MKSKIALAAILLAAGFVGAVAQQPQQQPPASPQVQALSIKLNSQISAELQCLEGLVATNTRVETLTAELKAKTEEIEKMKAEKPK